MSSVAEYLADLRSKCPARPSGSRPLPRKSASQTYQHEDAEVSALPQIDEPSRRFSPAAHNRTSSGFSVFSSTTSRNSIGRPLVQEPLKNTEDACHKVPPTTSTSPQRQPQDRRYRESGMRWMERQESISLRNALQEMDIQDEERRIHEAAQNEAADLVWKHQNPATAEVEKFVPYRNPDLLPRNKFAQELVKGVHSRSQSLNQVAPDHEQADTCATRAASDASSSSSNDATKQASAHGGEPRGVATRFYDQDALSRAKKSQRVSFISPSATSASSRRRRSNSQRKASNGSSRGVFRNPEDQIYVEPRHSSNLKARPQVRFADEPQPLQVRNENPRSPPERAGTASFGGNKSFNKYEIHQNSPTQSRNARYTTNTPTPPHSRENSLQSEVELKDGREIRSDEIRAATSMRRSDRSPKLPRPTAVSDRPGRPIVSFDRSWKTDDSSQEGINQGRDLPEPPTNLHKSTPAVPTIELPDQEPPCVPVIELPDSEPSLPVIDVSEEARRVPSISVSADEPSATAPSRPLPVPSKTSPNSKAKNSRLPWLNRTSHISPVSRQGTSTATCANCALPISGRILTASGSGEQAPKARFHPECFTCHHCSTPLECVAFYPEPEEKRKLRLQIQVEELGLCAIEELGEAIEKELRFFCHLDFHEFFSPRCKSCKTPIEGEVIVAAGGEYHVGHFFCAECGDVRIYSSLT